MGKNVNASPMGSRSSALITRSVIASVQVPVTPGGSTTPVSCHVSVPKGYSPYLMRLVKNLGDTPNHQSEA
jgi:hypothetical protein